ncbi:FUSC family protein [Streptomyces griseoluteus]|uniref:FUSC family protein n=1 Tax=Streptomyces griseoluteus TaxID=29306 RepID=UPI00342CB3FA
MMTHYWRAVLHATRHGFRVGRPMQNPQALLRVAVGIVLGTAVGYVLDQQMLCVGAWLAGLGSMIPHQRHRLGVSAASAALLCVVGPAVGVYVHGVPWLLYLFAFLGVFAGGMLMMFGIGLGMRAIIMTILMVALADLAPDVATGMTFVKWLALGGAIGWICQLLPPYGPRFATQRNAVAALYEALAADVRASTEDGTAHQPWPGPLLAARQTLTVLPQFSRAAAASLFGLVGEAERIARNIRVLQTAEGADPETYRARSAAIAAALSDVASAVRSGRPAETTADWASQGFSPTRSGEAHEDRLRDLGAALTEAGRLAGMPVVTKSDDSWRHAELALLHAEPGFAARGLRRLREELTWSSPVFQHALRLAVAATIAEAVGRATGDWGGLGEPGHAFWLFLTAAIVLFPTFEHTFSRGISRSAGAIAGGLIGWALTLLPDGRALHYLLLIVLLFLYLAFRSTGQPLMIMWITAWVSYLGAGGSSAWTRTADTVVGSVIAMALYLVWPTWQSKSLPRLLASWMRVEGRRLSALAAAWAEPSTADPGALDRMGHEARAARHKFDEAATHATSEPVHHLARWTGPELLSLSRSVHEVAKCSAVLTAQLPVSQMPGVPYAARYAEPLQRVMSELATAAETGAQPDLSLTSELRDVLGADLADTAPGRRPGQDVFDQVTHRVEDLASAMRGRDS